MSKQDRFTGGVSDPAFWKWLMKLDILACDLIGHCEYSFVQTTGYDSWVDYYLDGDTPRQALYIDISYGD